MRSNNYKLVLTHARLAASVLLLASGTAFAQQQVSLTAAPATATMPDGTAVPMWGYTCGTLPTGTTSTATCTALNKAVAAAALTPTPLVGVWSPVVVTVPTGQTLQINLTNSLSFLNGNTVPTSLVIVGQLGGGLGTGATSTPSPDHSNAQPLTWPIAGDAPGGGLSGAGTPPTQGPRVQSFSTEVPAGATAVSLTWTAPRPGTYLMESGTHPSIQGPMGLYGIVVVTCAPGAAAAACTTPGTAYPAVGTTPAVTYAADIPLLLSEIDPVQNAAVRDAVNTAGFAETNVWSGLSGMPSEVSAPGDKPFDVRRTVPPAAPALGIFARELSLSATAPARAAGMLASLSVNTAGLPAADAFPPAVASPDTYNSLVPAGNTL